LSEPDARKKVVAWIHQHTPDLLINNAGFGLYGDVLQHPTKSTLEILEVNANAALELTLEAAKALRAQNKKGTILNVSSVAAFYPYPSFAIYAAAKACVNHFSQALDREFKPYGIRVLTACPGKIATSFQQRASQGRFLKHEPFTMSPQKAARLIWKQIEKQKPLYVFDWPYRLALSLTACLPKCLVQQLLPKKH
jgi:short-subunit dehydrogenase